MADNKDSSNQPKKSSAASRQQTRSDYKAALQIDRSNKQIEKLAGKLSDATQQTVQLKQALGQLPAVIGK